jgi:hypothetical protein
MGTTLPIHNRKEKEIKPIILSSLSRSPRKILALLIVSVIIWYSFLSSTNYIQHEPLSPTMASIDYNINPLAWAPSLSERIGKSAYPKSFFTPQALLENEFNPVSAVVLRVTDDDESIIYAVKHLLKYNFISEIYIHNQIKSRPLTVEVSVLDLGSVHVY